MECKNNHCNNTIDSHSILCSNCIDNSFDKQYNFIEQSIINQIETSFDIVKPIPIKQVYKKITMYDIPNFY